MKRIVIAAMAGLLLLGVVPARAQQIIDDYWVMITYGNVLDGGGSGYNEGYWYVYPSGWINQWFYDHPFDDTRGKIIRVEFDWGTLDPSCPTAIEVAINWSTPEWSQLGHGDQLPPLPDEVGAEEDLYIERLLVLEYCGDPAPMQHFVFDYIIWDYNPEWVSIDVRGCNFEIAGGVIIHECAVGTEETSWGAIKALQR